MMIWGTFVMAAPAFLLAIGPYWWTLYLYLILMTVGEAMWSPRFLQYAAEIAPEGRTGEYMGVAQLPWFLTKVLVPLLYSGHMMDRYCPAPETGRAVHTEPMWLIFGCHRHGLVRPAGAGEELDREGLQDQGIGGRMTDAITATAGPFHPSRGTYRFVVLVIAGLLTFGSYFAYDSDRARWWTPCSRRGTPTARPSAGSTRSTRWRPSWSCSSAACSSTGIGTRAASLVFSALIVARRLHRRAGRPTCWSPGWAGWSSAPAASRWWWRRAPSWRAGSRARSWPSRSASR